MNPNILKLVSIRVSLPSFLLLLALSTVFLFGNDRSHFYRSQHDWISSQSMTLAANLSPNHHFLMFFHRIKNDEHGQDVKPYNRFPIGTYAIIKLTILPFADDLAAQIYSARMLMLLFFSLSAVLAYLTLRRLFAERWVALTATLLAFSSYYCLYFNDMISTEVTSLFGVMLVLHGMAVFVQEGHFRQLVIKTFVALLLGWHVMALLLPFVVFNLTKEAFGSHPPGIPLIGMRSAAASLLSSRYMLLGVVSLFFFALVLAFNLTNEYIALRGETPLSQLPTVHSMLKRSGITDVVYLSHPDLTDWAPFLKNQFTRIGGMSIPYYIVWLSGYSEVPWTYTPFLFIFGAAVFTVCLLGILSFRHRILVATAVLGGWCWALPMRASSGIHEFESLFHIGIPLVFFSVVVRYILRLSNARIVVGSAIGALFIFVLSTFQMGGVGHNAQAAAFHDETIADFDAVREIARDGECVFVPVMFWPPNLKRFAGAGHVVGYYLAGRVIEYWRSGENSSPCDFILMQARIDTPTLATPNNRRLFLYRGEDYTSHVNQMIEESEHIIHSDFDVYHRENKLVYATKGRCRDVDLRGKFFLHVMPVDEGDLSTSRGRQRGYFSRVFRFEHHQWASVGRCIAVLELPSYRIAGIRTGQYMPGKEPIWDGAFFLDVAAMFEKAELIIRSDFDVYLYGNRLIYSTRGQCGDADVSSKFFLHVLPVDKDELSTSRARQLGYANLNFFFKNIQWRSRDRCIAVRELPNYRIAGIRTGQHIPGKGPIWGGEFAFDG